MPHPLNTYSQLNADHGGSDMKKNDMIFTDENLVFHISNEAASGIDTQTIRLYNPNLQSLLEAAREVKSQKFFGDVDISELAKNYPFVPFKYQIENVNAMLNRFEGRGVFGDQVGLGKTIEALMTAHAMFESGAIKNVLLIVPQNTKNGWKNEIQEKFPNIFTIHDLSEIQARDDIDYLIATFGQMAKNKKDSNRVNNDIYIITDTTLKERIAGIFNALVRVRVSPYKNPINARDNKMFGAFKERLEALNLTSLVGDIDGILTDYGYNTQKPFDLLSYNTSTEEKLNLTIKLLTETKNRLQSIPARYTNALHKKNLIDCIDGYIKEFAERKYKFDDQFNKSSSYDLSNIISSSVSPVAEPTVDLMIIDEIHSFYESDEGMASTARTTFSGSKTTAMDYIAKIEKKFCLLLSATPIRTTLEDVFDLVYLADSKRFGNTKEEARDYFYNVICNVSPDEPHPLSKMFNSKNEAKRNNFFGLINNFFTRKRISEIYNDMKGISNGDLPSYAEIEKAIGSDLLDSLLPDILQKRKLMHRQALYLNSDVDNLAQTACSNWANDKFRDDLDEKRHMRTAIDAAIIGKLKCRGDGEITDKVQRHNAYSAVNWNRRKKMGIAFDIDDNDRELIDVCKSTFGSTYTNSQKRAAKVLLLTRRLFKVNCLLQEKDSKDMGDFIITSFEDRSKDPDLKKLTRTFLIDRIVEPILGGLCYDATLCYLSNSTSIDSHARKKIGENMATMYKLETDRDNPDHEVIVDPKKSTVEIGNPHQIAIVNEQHQAGINYQDYRSFIFAHMDLNGKRLLEPVDIEQWIGRIYRTGQVKSCRIVTVLTTIMQDESKNPDHGFLKWYYDILADPQGLDLYGNNTPDIAFLQPIIVDFLRASIIKFSEKTDISEVFKKTKLTDEFDFQKYSFSELLEFYYHIGGTTYKKFVQDVIRKLCKIPEFGKALSEN